MKKSKESRQSSRGEGIVNFLIFRASLSHCSTNTFCLQRVGGKEGGGEHDLAR